MIRASEVISERNLILQTLKGCRLSIFLVLLTN